MPPRAAAKASAAAGEVPQPTAQETHLFYSVIQNTKGRPEIDWDGVAAASGLKNAETAKVRYGQVKRKFGFENWVGGRPNPPKAQDEGGDDTGPQTPTTSRSKKTATITGTGAGVKKRTASTKRGTATPGTAPSTTLSSRTRKAKSQAILRIEKNANVLQQTAEEGEDEMESTSEPGTPETPTKTKRPRLNEPPAAITEEFADFPAVMPDLVIQRQAILVHLRGEWTVSPSPIEVHAQWLSRLPADIQSRFYSQANINGNPGGESDEGSTTDGNDKNVNNDLNANALTNPDTGTNSNTGTNVGNVANVGNGTNVGVIKAVGSRTNVANATGSNTGSNNFIVYSGEDPNATAARLFGTGLTRGARGIPPRAFAGASLSMPMMTPMGVSATSMGYGNIGLSNMGPGTGLFGATISRSMPGNIGGNIGSNANMVRMGPYTNMPGNMPGNTIMPGSINMPGNINMPGSISLNGSLYLPSNMSGNMRYAYLPGNIPGNLVCCANMPGGNMPGNTAISLNTNTGGNIPGAMPGSNIANTGGNMPSTTMPSTTMPSTTMPSTTGVNTYQAAIPIDPALLAQAERDQEERDKQALFGGGEDDDF
ncbi:hypothetical protein F5144DRAFT_497678 [Chaetomium tenue]|uniref:Uncharacterized protein n=1 Tax=Chaetomium tenue TaxID=1854479 RepID=A0ACB7NX00_9PEZI|nr:hypothetical protein F5144DRAFT_497678 [Chaetomium globosum]